MIRQPSSTLHRATENKMAASTRRVLKPTICSVPKGNLSVTPVIIRDILMKKAMIAKVKNIQLCKPLMASGIRKTVKEVLPDSDIKCYGVDSNGCFQSVCLLKKERRVSECTEKREDLKWNSPYQYHGERCYSSYSYKMTRRIRPLEIRGISKSSIDGLHPLPERPEEQTPSSYYTKISAEKRDSFDEFENYETLSNPPSPLTSARDSLRESPDSSRNQSELSDSNSWSVCTGNLTGRSSVYSWGNDDEFDRQASATVRRMFDEIDDLLFEKYDSQGSDPLTVECREWSTTFHHMRILGKQLVPPSDSGTQVVVVDNIGKIGTYARPDTAATAISLDDVKTETLINTFNGLSLSGLKVEPAFAPKRLRSLTVDEEPHIHPYAHLEEEIFGIDGDLEEYFAYDKEYIEPSEKAKDQRKNERNKLYGYPPVTPNAFATENIINEAFDRLWEEIVQCLRGLLHFYTERLARECRKNLLPEHVRRIDRPLDCSSARTFSRDSSFRMPPLSLQLGLKAPSGTPAYPNEASSLHELMLIRSLSLRQRDTLTSTVPPRDEENTVLLSRDQLRPISSTFNSKVVHGSLGVHHSDYQLYGKMSAKTTKRSGRLQPLQPMDRIKTPGVQENDVIGEIVRGTRLHTAGDHRLPVSNFPGFSPQIWNAKSGALPPIERLDTSDTLTTMQKDGIRSPKLRSIQINKRASSAATNESRRATHRDKIAVFPDSRPNTTHTFRSETPPSDAKRPLVHGNVSNLSTLTNSTGGITDPSDTTIGVLQGVSLPLGSHSHSTKTVSFDDDVEELENLVMWGHGPPLLSQQQKRRRTNVR